MASFLYAVFLAGCRIRILLLFSASASLQLCLPSVALLCYLCLPSFLSLGSLLPSTSVFLASVPFDRFFCSGTLRLPSSPRLVFEFLALFLLGHFLSSLCFGLVWFLFTFFVTQLNLSSFTTGSSLWAELSRMVFLRVDLVLSIFAPWSFVLFRFWSMVLFFFCFCSWLGGLSSASVRYFGVPFLLSLHGVIRLPVWAGFLSFHSLLLFFTFQVLSALSSSCLSAYLLSLWCGSCLFYSFFLVYTLCFTAGGGLLVSSLSPIMLRLQFFQPH